MLPSNIRDSGEPPKAVRAELVPARRVGNARLDRTERNGSLVQNGYCLGREVEDRIQPGTLGESIGTSVMQYSARLPGPLTDYDFKTCRTHGEKFDGNPHTKPCNL